MHTTQLGVRIILYTLICDARSFYVLLTLNNPANLKMAKIAALENSISFHKIEFPMMSPKQQILFLTIIGKTIFYFNALYPI